MNKEVIYLEPEDDITDALTKLQQAEQKLVAIVPPKKTAILRSSVNMKLVSRIAKECDKIVVIVTQDPAIVKVAMASRIPVAKNLQSRPVIPTEANVRAAEAAMSVDELDADDLDEKPSKSSKHSKSMDSDDLPEIPVDHDTSNKSDTPAHSTDTLSLTDDDLEQAADSSTKDAKSKAKSKSKSASSSNNFFVKYKKWFMIGTPVALLLIVALVWAFVFAPAATITVAISSTEQNFSENVNFTTDLTAENFEENRFLATEQRVEHMYTGTIDSNTKENQGEKAVGSITVSTTFIPKDEPPFTLAVEEGTTFSTDSGLRFVSTTSNEVVWDGDHIPSGCGGSMTSSCRVTVTVTVEAEKGGEDYNIPASETWHTYQGLYTVSNSMAFSGGTNKMVKIVSQKDLDDLAEQLLSEHRDEGREMVLSDVPEDMVVISGSFKAEVVETSSVPAVGDELKDGDKAEAKVKIAFTVYTVERAKIEDYIKQKLNLPDTERIYGYGDPYFERFSTIDEPARLKTVVSTGPIVTEDAIFDKAKGRKTGEVQSELRLMSGVSHVEIRTSFFWVNSIPNNRDKVTIILEGEGQE